MTSSPTEFLGETRQALRQVRSVADVPPTLRADIDRMIGQIDEGFQQVGGG
jgi:hypothetical protein